MAKQGHKDRLSAVDASFLAQEKESSHMHVGALVIFEGPAPSHEDFSAHIQSRLRLVPRYRQKLAVPRFEMGRPFWVDAPSFNIDSHVRHTALPRPGSDDQLRQLAGRIFSQRLDRSKPLWEVWLIPGFEEGKFAVISKTHHALAGRAPEAVANRGRSLERVVEVAEGVGEVVWAGMNQAPDIPLNVPIGPH